MLSVLIPVYNINCLPLVKNLIQQFEKETCEFEIICIDDASTKIIKENGKLNRFDKVSLIELQQNIGRSRIRNLLATKANYDWLLFLDADTLPSNAIFINKYLRIINNNPKEKVFSGGLAYRKIDTTKNNQLRYKYGKFRESISAVQRCKNPYATLLMSNTLIEKKVFKRVQFNSEIFHYGHEDSIFSSDLQKAFIIVKHIDNPVFHTGLESNEIFLKKSKIAVKNLLDLHQKGLIKPKTNKLLKWHTRTKMFFLVPLLSFIYKNNSKFIEKSLSKKHPSLLLFDFYRLCYLCYLSEMEK